MHGCIIYFAAADTDLSALREGDEYSYWLDAPPLSLSLSSMTIGTHQVSTIESRNDQVLASYWNLVPLDNT